MHVYDKKFGHFEHNDLANKRKQSNYKQTTT